MEKELGAATDRRLKEQMDSASDAVEAAIREMTVGIVYGSGERKWQGIAAGTLVRWGGRPLILTAEHVVCDTEPEDFRFHFRHDGPPIPVERDILKSLPGVPTALLKGCTELELGRVVMNRELDLAAIEVQGDLEEKYLCRFFDLADGGRSPAEGRQTIVMGFPSDVVRVTHDNKGVVFSYVEWTNVASDRTDLRDFDPARHFLTPYKLVETYPDAKPLGISGAAMWINEKDTSVVWRPRLDIAGVASAWYKGKGLLKMVRREVVEEFLAENVTW
jgi:hypothetical protein